ncbi:Uncharacterised protein [Mycobacteroides abscessus subsp. abscessus]|nr:Uncharacterised protein [Mycobacteroides abscessus subsp. abscessus]
MTKTRTGPSSSNLKMECSAPCRWMPHSGSSVIWTSATRQLVDGSQPGKSIPAIFRVRLRPPSQPTRYCARSVEPSESSTRTASSDEVNPVTSRPR